MQPSTLLTIVAFSAASLVSASSNANNGGASQHSLCRRGIFDCGRKPVSPPPEEPQPPTCPPWKHHMFGSLRPTIDGHCCRDEPRNALNCCRLRPEVSNPKHELECTSKHWQTVERYAQFYACNTNQWDSKRCLELEIPLYPLVMALYYPNQEFKPPKFFDPAAIALWSPGPMEPNMDYTPPGPSRLGRNPNGDPDPNKRYTVQKRGNIPNKASASPASEDIDEFEDAQEEPFKLVPEHVNQALNKSPRKRDRSEKYTPPGKSRLSKHPGGRPDLGDHGNFQKRGNSIGSFLLGDPLLGSGPHRLVYDEKGSPETVAERATRARPKQQRNLGYTSPGKSRFSQHPYGNPDSADHHEVQKRSSSRRKGSANPLLDAMEEGSSRHTRVRKHRSSPKPTSAAAKAIQKSNTGRKGNSHEWSPPGKSPLGRSSDGEASDEE